MLENVFSWLWRCHISCSFFRRNNIPEWMVFRQSDLLVQGFRDCSGMTCSSSWPRSRRRRNITHILGGSDGFTNVSGRRRGQEESIALDLSLNKAMESCWSMELILASYNVDHAHVLLSCLVNTSWVHCVGSHLWRLTASYPREINPLPELPVGERWGSERLAVGLGVPDAVFVQDMSQRDERGKAH